MANKLSPVVSGSGSLSALVTFREKLCRAFCIDSTTQPKASVSYTAGTPRFDGTTVFVPVSAEITIISPSCQCQAKVQLFTEEFIVAFQGQKGLPSSVSIESVGRIGGGADIRCGCARYYRIDDSLVIEISA